MAALVGACASVDEPGTSATSAAPVSDAAQAPAATSATRQADRRGTSNNPSMSKTGTPSIKIGAPGKNSVYFDYDRDDIKPEFRAVMEKHAEYLRAHPEVRGRIEGNADERGSREYNLALGQRRAEAVTNNLRLLGVPDSRLEAVSYGEEKPRSTGHEDASWAENRRGDLLLIDGGK
jgi:peptidoglycan-associated lipoprotein